MNVIYEQGLESLAGQLSAMGYDVHPLRSGLPADAVLYAHDAHGALSALAGRRGAVMLCVRGMSAGEVGAAIARRSAQPLFGI